MELRELFRNLGAAFDVKCMIAKVVASKTVREGREGFGIYTKDHFVLKNWAAHIELPLYQTNTSSSLQTIKATIPIINPMGHDHSLNYYAVYCPITIAANVISGSYHRKSKNEIGLHAIGSSYDIISINSKNSTEKATPPRGSTDSMKLR